MSRGKVKAPGCVHRWRIDEPSKELPTSTAVCVRCGAMRPMGNSLEAIEELRGWKDGANWIERGRRKLAMEEALARRPERQSPPRYDGRARGTRTR